MRIGVIDNGFEAHDDLVGTRSIEILCKPTPVTAFCDAFIKVEFGQPDQITFATIQ